MSKIYLVKSSEGAYEDYHVYNEKAFVKREDAEKYAKLLDEEHNFKPQFVTYEFICLLRECEELLPEWEDFPDQVITENNRDAYFEWQDKQREKQNKLLIDLRCKRGQYMTPEMLDQYERWESNSYIVWG